MAMAWVLGQPSITSPLTGGRNTAQVDQAFEAATAGLFEEARAEINSC